MAKTLFNISDKIVAGNAPGELLAYRDRIIADGGTLETFAETEAEIRRLQSLGLYDSLSLGYVAGGYKASKWYNIKGATGDLDVVRASTADRTARNGATETVGNNITAVDYDSGVLKGVQCFPASAPRAADNISKTGIASEIGQTEGVILVRMNLRELGEIHPSANRRIVAIGDGTTTNRIILSVNRANDQLRLDVIAPSVSVGLNEGSTSFGDKWALIRYKALETALFTGGSKIGTIAPTAIPATSILYIGRDEVTNALHFGDRMKSVFHWKTTDGFTDAVCQQLTTL